MHVSVNNKQMIIKTLFSAEQIHAKIKEISAKINSDYEKDETLVILIVLNGAFIFASDLVRCLTMPTEIETVRLKSYEGIKSSGIVTLLTPLAEHLENKNILIVEDIVETGGTLQFLIQELKTKKVKTIKICSLLNKPEAHETAIPVDYVGFQIGKNFVIGYGLDLDGKYRNLPYIAELISNS